MSFHVAPLPTAEPQDTCGRAQCPYQILSMSSQNKIGHRSPRQSSKTTHEPICCRLTMSFACRTTKKVTPILGGFTSSNYKTERRWATAPDGTHVPFSLVYRKDVAKLDGTDPVLLNGCARLTSLVVIHARDACGTGCCFILDNQWPNTP